MLRVGYRNRAFTLVELLNVIGIIAVLSAIFMPAIIAARNAAFTYNAVLSVRQLTDATSLYMMDHDDTFPVAMYVEGDALKAWFGRGRSGEEYDPKQGILAPYTNGRAARDMSHQAATYLGDHSGFGYNWGYLGSDTNITLNYWGFPNVFNPALGSSLSHPDRTIAFSTSIYFYAPWLQGGDGRRYDFGFIDPPKYWRGNPNVDFRHGGLPEVDLDKKEVRPRGVAVVAYAGGAVKTMPPLKMKDWMFYRQHTDQDEKDQ